MSNFNPHKRIAELEIQNQELLAENKRLRDMLGLSEEVTIQKEAATLLLNFAEEESLETSSINKYSLPEEKIKLFMSLFRGRTDVYAKRCYSKKHNSFYYIPACKNEWTKGLCDRPRVKCKDCKHRELLPVTFEVI